MLLEYSIKVFCWIWGLFVLFWCLFGLFIEGFFVGGVVVWFGVCLLGFFPTFATSLSPVNFEKCNIVLKKR